MNRLASISYCFLCIVLCLLCVNKVHAQIIDSTVVEAPYIEDEEEENEALKVTVPDTPVLRFVPDTVTHRLRQKKEYAYANDPTFWIKPKKEMENSGFWEYVDQFLRNKIVRLTFYILLALLIIFIVYRLIVTHDLFQYSSRSENKNHNEAKEKDLIDDEHLETKIKTAIDGGDFRLAIRFLYIKTLQILNHKGVISYHSEATNDYYVKQMNPTSIGKDFRFLTQVFEYVWYGEFTLSVEQFNVLYKDFTKFHDTIR